MTTERLCYVCECERKNAGVDPSLALPATFVSTNELKWPLCNSHGQLALIAGWNPVPINQDPQL